FRRFFGPFFRTARENALFFSLILLFPITLFFPYLQLPFIGVVAATLFLGFGRLFSAHRTLAKACKKLMPLVENPLALLIHLSDQEIKDVATCPDPRSYFLCQEGYRWQLIKERFIL
ncbi:MAG: hypothetical protein K0U13_02905, partial [Chlamydiae bacterium]|nr:hypothetical protein [Chlamydiota bacterium]